MATWNSRGLRGSVLEELINYANQKYKDKDLALIQKIPTPITPVRFDKESRHITLAYFEKKSTVDYIGAVQGIPVCFDAKECAADTFSLQNLHPHQVEFMKNFEKQNGISFLLIVSEKGMGKRTPLSGSIRFCLTCLHTSGIFSNKKIRLHIPVRFTFHTIDLNNI